MKERICYFDVLKGIAILGVLYTHCLQYLGINYYLDHPLFRLVYAFHMPLFMTVSGYFSAGALQGSSRELVSKKAVRLLLPCVTAAVVVTLVNRLLPTGDRHGGIGELAGNLWYLKSLFLCLLLAKGALLCSRGCLTVAIPLSLAIALALPLWHVSFMMPFFWMGYCWRQHPHALHRHGTTALLVSLVIFLLLFPWWDGRYTTYVTPFRLLSLHPFGWEGCRHRLPFLFRLTMGISGTILVVSTVRLLPPHGCAVSLLARLGRHTLELYTLHSILMHTGVLAACAVTYRRGWYEAVYCLLATLLLLVLCLCLTWCLKRWRLSRLLFFGE